MKIKNVIAIGYMISYNVEYIHRQSIHKETINTFFICLNEIIINVRTYTYSKGKQYSQYSLFENFQEI